VHNTALRIIGQGGENPEHELAAGRGGVDVGSVPGEDFEADPPVGEFLHRVHEMTGVSAEPIEFPDDQDIPFPEGFEAGHKARSVVALAGGLVVVEVFGFHARRGQGVFLQVEHLAAVGFGDAGVSDEKSVFHGIAERCEWGDCRVTQTVDCVTLRMATECPKKWGTLPVT
jgi:hypothetical protein